MALVAAASLVPMFWTWQADDYAKLDTRGVVCVTPLRQYFPNSTESLRTRKLAMPPRTASCLTARRNYPPAAHQRYVSGSGRHAQIRVRSVCARGNCNHTRIQPTNFHICLISTTRCAQLVVPEHVPPPLAKRDRDWTIPPQLTCAAAPFPAEPTGARSSRSAAG